MMLKIGTGILALISPILLAGCGSGGHIAASTHETLAYRPAKGFWTLDNDNSGYTEKQISSDVWQIDVTSNNVTLPKRVEDIAIFRAADVGKRNGYSSFKISDKKAGLHCVSFQSSREALNGEAFVTLTAQYSRSRENGFESIDDYIAAHEAAIKAPSAPPAEREATHDYLVAACTVLRERR